MLLRKAGAISEAFDLRLHILKVDLLVGDKVSVILKELTAVDGQEFQFPQQNIGAFFDAREQVHQLGIQVVINVQSVWVRRQRQQHRTAAAERFHILRQLGREKLQDVRCDLLLAADPGKGRLSHVRPPRPHGTDP